MLVKSYNAIKTYSEQVEHYNFKLYYVYNTFSGILSTTM